MANTRGILPLLWVLYLQCVFAIYEYEYVLKFNQTKKIEYVNVVLGSSVTLVCPNRQNYRVSWYKHLMADSAAFIDYKDGSCVLDNDNYPSISLGRHRCRGGNYSIRFSSIQYRDSGVWWCSISTIEQQSQLLKLTVIPGVATTPSTSTTTTSTQQVAVPTNPITTTRSTTKKGTTQFITTSTKASFISSTTTETPTRGESTKAIFISSTHTERPTRVKTSVTKNRQTSQPVSTASPDPKESGDGNQPADKSTSFMIHAIVGALVGVVLLVLVVMVVTLCVRARKKSHMEQRRQRSASYLTPVRYRHSGDISDPGYATVNIEDVSTDPVTEMANDYEHLQGRQSHIYTAVYP